MMFSPLVAGAQPYPRGATHVVTFEHRRSLASASETSLNPPSASGKEHLKPYIHVLHEINPTNVIIHLTPNLVILFKPHTFITEILH